MDPDIRLLTENSFKEGRSPTRTGCWPTTARACSTSVLALPRHREGNGKGQAAFLHDQAPRQLQREQVRHLHHRRLVLADQRACPAPRCRAGNSLPDAANQRLTLAAFLKYVAQNKGSGQAAGNESDYDQAPAAPAKGGKP